jgi:hypothetical protein
MKTDFLSINLRFPFTDQRWVMKLTIGTLLILASMAIPLVPLFFVAGYCLRIIQRIIHGDGQPALPEWDDWDWLFKNGFKLSEAGLLYALPGLVLFMIGYIMVFYPILGISLARLASTTALTLSPEATGMLHQGAILLGAATILTLIGAFFSAPATMHMAARNSVRAVFQIREWWAILRLAPGKFIGAYTLITTATILLLIIFTVLTITLVFCLPASILISVGGMYISVTASAMFASAYRSGLVKSI